MKTVKMTFLLILFGLLSQKGYTQQNEYWGKSTNVKIVNDFELLVKKPKKEIITYFEKNYTELRMSDYPDFGISGRIFISKAETTKPYYTIYRIEGRDSDDFYKIDNSITIYCLDGLTAEMTRASLSTDFYGENEMNKVYKLNKVTYLIQNKPSEIGGLPYHVIQITHMAKK